MKKAVFALPLILTSACTEPVATACFEIHVDIHANLRTLSEECKTEVYVFGKRGRNEKCCEELVSLLKILNSEDLREKSSRDDLKIFIQNLKEINSTIL